MDREILFRGRRLDNGEWVEGSYMEHYYSSRFGCVSAIFTNDDVLCKTYRIPVDPSTVGQYTGLTDKNGKKIFEGDIIKANWMGRKTAPVTFESGMYKVHGMSLITWLHHEYDGEVIGSVHDNPELIGGEGDG